MMRPSGALASVTIGLALVVGACGGGPEPEPVEPAPDTTATTAPDTAGEGARREAEAARLCERARSAMEAGDYDRARQLYSEAAERYPGTECARTASDQIDRVDAIAAIRERVHFEFDRSAITDEAAQVLQRKAEALRQYPDVEVTVEGHADERGSLEYNQALGMRRAESAKQYLVSLGLEADRMRTVSYGEERPLVDESNEQAWSMNRRAEFVITDMGGLAP